ncbi:MAG: preprotein translocase subunit YajC [Chloroflexota bacterium]|nr:preprotein translocase subunit YajC [Chloroflexota bacterium]
MGNGNTIWWLVILAGGALFLFLPQWLSRRKQARRLAAFEVGDQVITIGGFIGTLTAIDLEENVARLRLAAGVEVELVPGALSRKLVADGETAEQG